MIYSSPIGQVYYSRGLLMRKYHVTRDFRLKHATVKGNSDT